MNIRERAQVALEGAKARTDVDDFAAHILRITSPEMRERVADAVRNASVTRPSGAEDWDDIVADATDAIMGLLTEEPTP